MNRNPSTTLPAPEVFDLSPEIFEITLNEMANDLRRMRTPHLAPHPSWQDLSVGIRKQWVEEANLTLQLVHMAIYGRTLKVGP